MSWHISSQRVIALAVLLLLVSVSVPALADPSLNLADASRLVAGVMTGERAERGSSCGQSSDVPGPVSGRPDSSTASACYLPRARLMLSPYRLARHSVYRSFRPTGDIALLAGTCLATTPSRSGSRVLAVLPSSALQHCISLQRLLL